MNRGLRPSWKTVAGWTVLFHLVALVVVVRYRVTRHLQQPWAERLEARAESDTAAPAPEPVDFEREDVDGLVAGAVEAWGQRDPAESLRALENRERELDQINPEHLERVVTRLRERVPDAEKPVSRVEISELDLNRSAPVHMRRGENEAGQTGVWIEMMDDQRRVAEIWMDESEMGVEERRALQAFELMERHPTLKGLQPVIFDILTRGMTDDE